MNIEFEWSSEKNTQLRLQRNISFEEVIIAINEDNILRIEKGRPEYPHQKTYIIKIKNYAYMVPFIDNGKKHFLKTIIPSRVHTKIYLKKDNL